MLKQYVEATVDITPERPILIDKFLEDATELKPMPLQAERMPLLHSNGTH